MSHHDDYMIEFVNYRRNDLYYNATQLPLSVLVYFTSFKNICPNMSNERNFVFLGFVTQKKVLDIEG